MCAFKVWKESIIMSERIQQEEETKLRSATDHLQNYYMKETVLQAGNAYGTERCLRVFRSRDVIDKLCFACSFVVYHLRKDDAQSVLLFSTIDTSRIGSFQVIVTSCRDVYSKKINHANMILFEISFQTKNKD
jgi:hypothetical protein